MISGVIAIVIASTIPVSASPLTRNEAYYAGRWCAEAGGVSEVVAPSGARVDCLLDGYAVEADWTYKWAESIGQALHYGAQFHRQPAILMLVPEDYQQSHIDRLQSTIDDNGLGIELFFIDAPKRERVK
jgi:hypothetical protein